MNDDTLIDSLRTTAPGPSGSLPLMAPSVRLERDATPAGQLRVDRRSFSQRYWRYRAFPSLSFVHATFRLFPL